MKIDIQKSLKWSVTIAVITLVLAAIFSVISNAILEGANWAVGIMIVFIIVLIGVIFDIIGVAATATDEKPFHAMASDKVKGAKNAIAIARNADRVSNFCNDVIGDISGVVSGTASAVVVLELAISIGQGNDSPSQYVISVIFTSLTAAVTVGGKALGKTLAIKHATPIIFQVGRFFYFLEHRFHIKILKDTKTKKKHLKKKQKVK
ncbi:hypothetical protein GCM10011391_15520 [Pullulanibacillus camelliae]|uniref:CNNM transmembrane domain-containing protein n=1 Tax=Pullulanibacillus camelliae TaxID=1707096 RepID=A0A8J2VLX5_9BACL|nr:hypothetical protein [Pullulanibacillus camelliae]GGE37539.1 hypothetical protein GCM10011391_15520 [Pullulanibacillus camelliae]